MLVTINIVISCNSDNSEDIIIEDYVGDVILKTQIEVDDFGKKEYLNIIGSLWITPEDLSDIQNLSALKSLTCISGDLVIKFSNLIDLSGFNNLTKIEGGLYMNSNPSLASLTGLSKLETVGTVAGRDMLQIDDNNSLVNIDGLKSLTTITGILWIANNSSIANIRGVNNLSTINRHLWILNNPKLTSLEGLEKIEFLGESEGHLLIDDNDSLLNLKGLENLSIIKGYIQITNNNALIDFNELANLTLVNYGVNIQDNSSLVSLDGFINLKSAGGFTIQSNSVLADFCGLKPFLEEDTLDTQYIVNSNLYNPTKEQIVDGNCSN
ncbi:receptor L domain-containing protein [Aureibaculum algae]|nr:hypothetical protein [Aureibaculum algae]